MGPLVLVRGHWQFEALRTIFSDTLHKLDQEDLGTSDSAMVAFLNTT